MPAKVVYWGGKSTWIGATRFFEGKEKVVHDESVIEFAERSSDFAVERFEEKVIREPVEPVATTEPASAESTDPATGVDPSEAADGGEDSNPAE